MSLPSITITFAEKAKSLLSRTDKGVVGMILKDAAPTTNPAILYDVDDIPSTASAASVTAMKMALKGYDKSPLRVEAYFVGEEATDYTAALNYFATANIDYLCAPICLTDNQVDAIKTWVIDQRTDEDSKIKAVLPKCAADNEGIINFATEEVYTGDTKYTAEQMTARVAGILASTGIDKSATFAPIPEATGCTTLSKTDLNKSDENGQLVAFFDGEKVKLGRAVNSLTTTANGKGDQWKKIRIINIMDIIKTDIHRIAEDSYIGKYAATYDNKCLLVGAIQNYFNTLITEGALYSAEVGFNLPRIKEYLVNKGESVNGMSDDQLKQHDTGSYVFLSATIGIADAIEDITLDITI
ncbi:MAG: phage tail sheath protein [Atopobium sp.]|nr:phage tail sheath protein [Atopobium sp.]